jgi:competence protein ComGF
LVSSFLDLSAMKEMVCILKTLTISSRMYFFADVKKRLNQALVKKTS